ncbi:MAG: hypothetical protein ACNYVW_01190 [Methanosarcinales archaeon]
MRKKVIPKMLSCLVAIAVLVIILPCIAEASVVEPMEYGWRIYLEDGVDYLSMPVIPDDVTPDAVFGSDVEIFGYEPETGYIMPTVLEEGKGYFVRCLEPKTVDVRGTNVESITWATVKANLQLGWNLVGIGKTDVTIEDDIEAIGWDAVEDKWITLGKGDTLQRGSAYWIELSLSAPLAAEVSAQQQPPPAPPEVTEIVVTSDPTNILADGSSTSNITATVTEWENVASPVWFIIAFEVLSEPGGVSLYPEFDMTDVNGNAYSTLTAGLTAGTVVVKAVRGEAYNTTSILLTTLTTPPNITFFTPASPVNDTVGNWETFTITVNQQVNVSWYLNDSLLFTNRSVTDTKYSLHAEVVGEHNVSAIATNQNGRDMQTWIWYVTTAPPTPAQIPTLMPIGIIALVGLLVLVALSRIKRKT